MEIKDSGTRREFDTGAVRDIQEGKGRCDLLPFDVVSIFMTDNAEIIFSYLQRYTETGDTEHLTDLLAKQTILEPIETMLLEVSKHFEEGAKKYGEYNWQKGIPANCYIDSAVRHYLKYLRGDKDEPHDRAFIWNIMCCIWTCINKPELNVYTKSREEKRQEYQEEVIKSNLNVVPVTNIFEDELRSTLIKYSKEHENDEYVWKAYNCFDYTPTIDVLSKNCRWCRHFNGIKCVHKNSDKIHKQWIKNVRGERH